MLAFSINSKIKFIQSAKNKLFFQPKLSINQPNDIYEQEADAMADRVIRVTDASMNNNSFFKPTITSGQRKCAHCEEEEKQLKRKSISSNEAVSNTSVENYISSLSGKGRSLPKEEKDFFEPRFGYDFSRVRVHTDNDAVRSARSVNALAYTHENNIVFGANQFAPDSYGWKKLLAHELTHVVQQGSASNSMSIQKFEGEEHVEIGNRAQPGQRVYVGSEVPDISYGELIAIAGDYFESIREINGLANDIYGRDQVLFALWKVNPTRPRPLVSQQVERTVMDRYYRLAARNETHFSTGSAPGRSNREQYINGHTEAISAAYQQGASGIIMGVGWEAKEAFSNHFLTDAFAGGHIRTPRGQLRSHWNGMYPNFTNNLKRIISCYMASYINDVDSIGNIATVNQIADGIVPILESIAGAALSSFSIGDLISIALHDKDNEGLDVVSSSGITGSQSVTNLHWRAVGDSYLFNLPSGVALTPGLAAAQQQTQRMVIEAVRLSFEEARQAFAAGHSRTTPLNTLINVSSFRALNLLPQADANSVGNATYAWQASSIRNMPANIQALLIAEFSPGGSLRNKLDALEVDCVTVTHKVGTDWNLHTRAAWLCFKRMLLSNVMDAIIRIGDGTNLCPQNQDNPCLGFSVAC